MKNNFYRSKLLIIVFAITFLNANNSKSLEGTLAPHWSLKTFLGEFKHLGNYSVPLNKKIRGNNVRKVVVQSFFASWCQPCIKEISELQKIQEQYQEDDVEFFLINLTDYFRNKDGAGKKYKQAPDAETFLKAKGLDKIKVLNDPTGRTARAYKVNDALPRLFVIDKYGIIRKDETGLCSTCLNDEIVPLIEHLLAK